MGCSCCKALPNIIFNICPKTIHSSAKIESGELDLLIYGEKRKGREGWQNSLVHNNRRLGRVSDCIARQLESTRIHHYTLISYSLLTLIPLLYYLQGNGVCFALNTQHRPKRELLIILGLAKGITLSLSHDIARYT